MQKTADRSNSHTSENNSVTEHYSIVTYDEIGNALVTELLPKSAYSCPFRKRYFYANRSVSPSLSVSLHQLRFLFIFVD